MKFVLAPDSFKESMTSKLVADSMERGIKKIEASANCVKIPMADGGEGTTESLVEATGGSYQRVKVTGPLGDPVQGLIGILEDGKTGVIEIASASGLALLPKDKRNPLKTTSYGVGQLIEEVLNMGLHRLIIGLGGSATNDGGAGMLQALGGSLLDSKGRELELGGAYLGQLHTIDLAGLLAFLSAELISGVDLIIKYTNLEEHIKAADFVFTGEGSVDGQTISGKTPYGVARLAAKYKLPTIVLVGHIGDDIEELYGYGMTSIFSIVQGPCSLEEALKNGPKNIEKSCENIARLLLKLRNKY